MRILHSADWHLGRQFHNVSLLEDQAHVLAGFVDLVDRARPDVVIVAGDVYDRSVPPQEAIELLERTLEAITLEHGVPVILIAGNHDGARRLGFASRFVARGGLHLFGPLDASEHPVVLEDAHGPVAFCPLPYADPAEVRLYTGDDAIRTHDAVHEALVRRVRAHVPSGARSVAVGHCWVVGGEESESERPLTVGGTGHVRAEHFAAFDYTALGHLHRPQTILDTIRYAGSLLKYSFSEIGHRKSVSLVEIDANGAATIEPVELEPLRDVRVIEGALAHLLREPQGDTHDLLLVRLTDPHAILDPMGKLRQVYPNALHVERRGLAGRSRAGAGTATREQLQRSDEDLFRAFFEDVTGDAMIAGGDEALATVLEELRVDGEDDR